MIKMLRILKPTKLLVDSKLSNKCYLAIALRAGIASKPLN
jgi:hypothetical protein